jgi:hypothetical protein
VHFPGSIPDFFSVALRRLYPLGLKAFMHSLICLTGGDGTFSSWLGPYPSGEICEAKCTWGKSGNYLIKVKAKNSNEVESFWSDSLPITMPYSFNKQILSCFKFVFSQFSIVFPLLRPFIKI